MDYRTNKPKGYQYNICSHLLYGIVLQVDSEQVGILAQLLHLKTKYRDAVLKLMVVHFSVPIFYDNLSIRTPDETSTLKPLRSTSYL